jgi:hypothetical protein
MTLKIERIIPAQAEKIRLLDEGQFADVKGREIAPKGPTINNSVI